MLEVEAKGMLGAVDESSLLPRIAVDEIETVRSQYAQGRMRIKLLGAQEAT